MEGLVVGVEFPDGVARRHPFHPHDPLQLLDMFPSQHDRQAASWKMSIPAWAGRANPTTKAIKMATPTIRPFLLVVSLLCQKSPPCDDTSSSHLPSSSKGTDIHRGRPASGALYVIRLWEVGTAVKDPLLQHVFDGESDGEMVRPI